MPRNTFTTSGVDLATAELPFSIRFVINWGFTLLAIPLVWIIATIWLKRHPIRTFSTRWTFISGLALLIDLAWFVLAFSPRAGSSLNQVQPI